MPAPEVRHCTECGAIGVDALPQHKTGYPCADALATVTTLPPLRPCPFCGGEAEVKRRGTGRVSCIVTCLDCGCRLESNERGAGHFWNHRVP